ncbi:MAG TPA: SDR family NAD(P)-dependent oxidoreductase [Gemmatimonadota bacterium]|nr:SDR family NAD(P)-dependent oxidoreductase [Gemmatimonadota bacterium]
MGRDLQGRVVVITGASSGIGAATAVACGRRGMRVALFARREGRLEAIAERVRSAGGDTLVQAGDVRDRGAIAALVTAATRRWGSLDALIASAGFGIAAPVADTPPEEAREIFEVNVLGTVWAIQAAWPVFEVQRRGHVVIVSSAAAIHGIPANALYSATKAAQANLAEGLRIEAHAIGVDVSVVFPVVTETEFVGALRDHTGGRKREAQRWVGGPRQSPEDVARAIMACLGRPRDEVYPYRLARLMPWLEALSPSLHGRILRFPEYYRRQMSR